MRQVILSISILLCPLAMFGAEIDTKALEADMAFFTDASCSKLRNEVKADQLKGFKSELLKKVAAEIFRLGRGDAGSRRLRWLGTFFIPRNREPPALMARRKMWGRSGARPFVSSN